MHHGGASHRSGKLAFLFDRSRLLSRPDLGTDGHGAQA
jgi:hypothetical protein